jgi:uncharacterized integral membrane protein
MVGPDAHRASGGDGLQGRARRGLCDGAHFGEHGRHAYWGAFDGECVKARATKKGESMWVVRWIGLAVIVVLTLIFFLENIGTPPLKDSLALRFWGMRTPELPVFLWLVLCFFGGVFLYMIIGLIREIRLRAEIARLKSELDTYRDEAEKEPEETVHDFR